MLNLIKNEWMKLWSKKSTWAMTILLVVIIFGFTGLAKLTDNLYDDEEWIRMMETDIVDIEEQLAATNLEDEERADLEMEKQFMEEAILSHQPTTRETIIAEAFGIMSIVTLLTIIVAGGIVSTEFSEGTVKMLLSRPVHRWKILTSKYLTVVLFALFATFVTYITSVIGALIFFSSGQEESFLFYGTEIAVSDMWKKSIYMMFLSFVNVIIISTLAFMLGTVFRSTSLAIGISIFLYFTGGMIVAFLSQYSFAKFILFAHTNLTYHEIGYMMLPDITMAFSVGVILVYGIVFLVLSYVSFMKRDVMA